MPCQSDFDTARLTYTDKLAEKLLLFDQEQAFDDIFGILDE